MIADRDPARVSGQLDLSSLPQVRAAAAGLGLAFVSRRVAASHVAAGTLAAVSVAGLRMVRPIVGAYHRDKHVSTAMRQLIDLARRQAHPSS